MGEVTPLPQGSAICCDVGAAAAFVESDDAPAIAAAAAPLIEQRSDGTAELSLAIENLQCAACLPKIEGALRRHAGLVEGRVNLTLRRLKLAWRPEQVALVELLRAVLKEGYRVAPFDQRRRDKLLEEERKGLLRALAVAGFAAGNVMLFSVSVWAGLVSDMSAVTRQFMNWVAAAIALPAVAYAVRPFLRSAITVLKAGRLNMDVPITLAVLLATGMSLFQVMQGGERVYFDAALSLLFFLLIGRYLDLLLRGRARSAAENLLALQVQSAERIEGDGTRRSIALSLLKVGERVAVAPGQRLPVDGVILSGQSELDVSLITGESLPEAVGPGSSVRAGTLNLVAELIVQVRALGEGTLLAEIVRLVEAAEQGRARSIRLADRMARFYAPAVHILAAVTFVGSYLLAALSPELSLLNAIAVLIVTCPCAIGLAVPAVQVAAVGRLLKRGILVKEADALERLAAVDHVVFDKTGTLTQGKPVATNLATIAPAGRRLAAGLAAASRHPLARALVKAEGPVALPAVPVRELPGQGLMTEVDGVSVKLGSAAFVGAPNDPSDGQMELWLRRGQAAPLRFTFADQLRPDAKATIAALQARGLTLEILSGDRAPAVAEVAGKLGISQWQGGLSPKDKADRLAELQAKGRRVLMVGDGLNDAAALSGALVSLSPSDAIGISQNAADAIFQGASLKPIAEALSVSRRARRLVRQNFSFALAYNLCAVPLAMAGLVTPLLAAIFMSSSSLIVTLNAARLAR